MDTSDNRNQIRNCDSLRIFGFLLIVGGSLALLAVIYAVFDVSIFNRRFIISDLQVGIILFTALIVPIGVLILRLEKNNPPLGFITASGLFCISNLFTMSTSRNDIVVLVTLVAAILYAVSMLLIKKTKYRSAGILLVIVGIINLPIGVFPIFFGLRLRSRKMMY